MTWIQETLAAPEWKRREAALEQRLGPLLRRYIDRRSRHHKDPVLDFLFAYYNFRPAALLRWTPGLGVALEGPDADAFLSMQVFVRTEQGVTLDPRRFTPRRMNTLRWIQTLLSATQARAPWMGCFGMHEWAMVYRTSRPRHEQIPLRLSAEEIAAFVESRPLRCTHFDAFRFFTPAARPLNRVALTRHNQEEHEQPACLHANMDLYKWAHKLYPWIPSELVADAFAMAVQARTVDMQASPYDMRDAGLEPIRVETPEGRQHYQDAQQQILEQAAPLRQRLLTTTTHLLENLAPYQPSA